MTVDEIQLNDPQTLSRRWEDSQWSPFSIDLAADAEQWKAMAEADRSLIYWVLSSLMVAEERITTKFSGLVGAHGSEEEAAFLSTQQVDEARHMQFYARYQDEVVADPAGIGEHVARAREQLSPAFEAIFDGALVQAHEQLVAAPADLAAKTRFVTIYHLILEATLGLTTFNFVTGHLTREQQLPGFVDGYSKIHHDETRHIGYGIWFLRDTVRDHPEQADTVRQTMRDLLPSVAESLAPRAPARCCSGSPLPLSSRLCSPPSWRPSRPSICTSPLTTASSASPAWSSSSPWGPNRGRRGGDAQSPGTARGYHCVRELSLRSSLVRDVHRHRAR